MKKKEEEKIDLFENVNGRPRGIAKYPPVKCYSQEKKVDPKAHLGPISTADKFTKPLGGLESYKGSRRPGSTTDDRKKKPKVDNESPPVVVQEVSTNFINSAVKDSLMESKDESTNTISSEVSDIVINSNVNLNKSERTEESISSDVKSVSNKSLSDSSKMQDSLLESESDTDTDLRHSTEQQYSQSDCIIDTIKILTKTTSKSTDFKINGMRILLTYQGVKINKTDLLDYVSDIIESKVRKIDEYVIAHELCEKGYTYHTHMYIKFNRGFQSNNSKLFDYNGTHPNVERILHHTINIKTVLVYLFRKDNEAYNNLDSERIQEIEQSIVQISNRSNRNKKDTETIKRFDESSKTQIILENNVNVVENWNFKPWQKFLLSVIEGKVDKKVFYWCLEPSGFTEKTELTKYIVSNYKHVLVINKINNVIEMYLETIKLCPVEIVIFDLSWKLSYLLTNSENSDIFEFIEMLKTSYIPKVSFQNGGLILKPCHVIIFSYCLEGIKEIDPNRWKIIKILEDGEAYMGHVTSQSKVEYNETHILV